jgi:hypothetical protein
MKRGDPSPPNGSGARESAGPENEDINARRIPKNSDSRNRQLREKRGAVRLWALSEGRRTTYQVVVGQSAWAFNLLFPAISKFDRLVSRIGGAQQP